MLLQIPVLEKYVERRSRQNDIGDDDDGIQRQIRKPLHISGAHHVLRRPVLVRKAGESVLRNPVKLGTGKHRVHDLSHIGWELLTETRYVRKVIGCQHDASPPLGHPGHEHHLVAGHDLTAVLQVDCHAGQRDNGIPRRIGRVLRSHVHLGGDCLGIGHREKSASQASQVVSDILTGSKHQGAAVGHPPQKRLRLGVVQGINPVIIDQNHIHHVEPDDILWKIGRIHGKNPGLYHIVVGDHIIQIHELFRMVGEHADVELRHVFHHVEPEPFGDNALPVRVLQRHIKLLAPHSQGNVVNLLLAALRLHAYGIAVAVHLKIGFQHLDIQLSLKHLSRAVG